MQADGEGPQRDHPHTAPRSLKSMDGKVFYNGTSDALALFPHQDQAEDLFGLRQQRLLPSDPVAL